MPSRMTHAKKLGSDEGVSLLEIILAIAIVVVSLSALVAIAATANRSVATSRGHTIADQFVRGGIESIRNYRDNYGWNTLIDRGGANEIPDGGAKYYAIGQDGQIVPQTMAGTIEQPCPHMQSSAFQLEGGYYRAARMSLDGNELTIRVTVCYEYKDDGTSRDVAVTTMLTNWR